MKWTWILWIAPFFFIFYGFHIRIYHPDQFLEKLIALDIQEEFAPFHCPKLIEIVSNPLHYIGHGRQSIAFASQDKRFVIKFFLNKPLLEERTIQFPSIRGLLPFYRKMKEKKFRAVRLSNLMQVLKIYNRSFLELKEETGLVAVHLNTTTLKLPFCTVVDKVKNAHQINLSRASFVIQHLGTALSLKESKESIPYLDRLFENRARKGFTDKKRNFKPDNYALLENCAIMIDPGNIEFIEEQKKNPEKEIQRIKQLVRTVLNLKQEALY